MNFPGFAEHQRPTLLYHPTDIRDLNGARTLIVFARLGVVARRTLGTRSPSGLAPLFFDVLEAFETHR